MTADIRTVTLRLPPDLHERLRLLAFKRRTSINALLIGYATEGLERDEVNDDDHAQAPDPVD